MNPNYSFSSGMMDIIAEQMNQRRKESAPTEKCSNG